MTNSLNSRRAFFGTLGKALGAGGLLLPWGGRGALALPADLGKAAHLPVTVATLPFSPEAIQLRAIRDALHRTHRLPHSDARSREWTMLMTEHCQPLERAIVSRQQPTMADCVELAEIIWHAVAKEDQTVRNGDWEYQEYSGMLSAGHRFATSSYQCREAIVALVEAVLTLGDGERRDPKTPQGFYPAGQRTGSPNRAT